MEINGRADVLGVCKGGASTSNATRSVQLTVTRRVLIVTGSYYPTIVADMHRARHLAWEMSKVGWEVEILCPDESYQRPEWIEEDSSPFFAPGTATHLVP